MTQGKDKKQERDKLWDSWCAHSQAQVEARKDDSNGVHKGHLASFAERSFFFVECDSKQRKRETMIPAEQQVCVQKKRTRKEAFHDRDINTCFAILAFSLSLFFSSCWLEQIKKTTKYNSSNNKC
jgi:hypothetical protein